MVNWIGSEVSCTCIYASYCSINDELCENITYLSIYLLLLVSHSVVSDSLQLYVLVTNEMKIIITCTIKIVVRIK